MYVRVHIQVVNVFDRSHCHKIIRVYDVRVHLQVVMSENHGLKIIRVYDVRVHIQVVMSLIEIIIRKSLGV